MQTIKEYFAKGNGSANASSSMPMNVIKKSPSSKLANNIKKSPERVSADDVKSVLGLSRQ